MSYAVINHNKLLQLALDPSLSWMKSLDVLRGPSKKLAEPVCCGRATYSMDSSLFKLVATNPLFKVELSRLKVLHNLTKIVVHVDGCRITV